MDKLLLLKFFRPPLGGFALLAVALAGCQPSGSMPYAPSTNVARELHQEMLAKAGVVDEAAEAEAQPTKTGWATLKGRIVVVGSPPSLPPLTVNKDTEVCQPGGHPVPNQAIEVGTDGGLANVAVYALGLSGDNVHESATGGQNGEVLFDQKKCVFLSHLQTMRVGQKLKILNSDPVSHNTLIRGVRNAEFNQTVGPGQQAYFTPAKPERTPVNVECSIHPWMRAYLLPHENGYAVATRPDGSFEIANLPAGIELKLQLWHETAKNLNEVEIEGGGKLLKRGVLSVQLEPDQTTELNIKVPATAFR